MRKIITTLLFFLILTRSFGQAQRTSSLYLQGQYNRTVYDRTLGNNPWGIGLGLQYFFNSKTKLNALVDLTADAYLEDDKVFRMNSDGSEFIGVGKMINLFAGASFHPAKKVYISFVAGPGFINGQALVGMKPSFGFYFSQNQRWAGKISYINIFDRDKTTKDDFGSISLSIGVKLF